ncbi:MAG: RHS repeat protein [Myxococcales bacterium]|nr:RHS repeat protein [Myxococcales bacterium]
MGCGDERRPAAVGGAVPLLGPFGWFVLGPVLADGERVWFEPADCAIHISAADAVGEEPGLEIRREWDGTRWAFVGDTAPPIGATRVVRDARGLLISFVRDGRLTAVLRDSTGAFAGLTRGRAGARRVSTVPAMDARGNVVGTEDRWTADGATATLRWESGHLASAETPRGLTRYAYATGALSSVRTADGGGAVLSTGRIVVGAAEWQCDHDEQGTTVTVGGDRWHVAGSAASGQQRVTDPSGGVTVTRWEDGLLAGWTDPMGSDTALIRESSSGASGGIVGVRGVRSWDLSWRGEALASISGADRWTLRSGSDGDLASQTDAVGEMTPWDSADGLVRGWGSGADRRLVARDDEGQVTSVTVGGRVSLSRDPAGRIVGVTNPGGGEWRLSRDGMGRVSQVTDPGGARWRIGWDVVGRVASVTDSSGRQTTWDREEAGIASVRMDGQAWHFGRDTHGRVRTAEDPWGRRWTVSRDALGRPVALVRPDQSTFRMKRDRVGNLVGVDDFSIRRDEAGRPTAWSRGRQSGGWSWDDLGWTGVRGPGIAFTLTRDPAGRVSGVELESGEAWKLARDTAGRVLAVAGPGAVTLGRDSSGRVNALSGSAGVLRLHRDGRGLVSRVDVERGGSSRSWLWRRDGAGRVLGVEAPEGVRLGVDRDEAGRPLLARFQDGSLAKYVWDGAGVGVLLQDAGSALLAVAGWSFDGLGRVTRLRGEVPTLLQRDPLGVLTVQEGADVWSQAPDGVEGPRGAALTWDADGRPLQGRVPEGAPPLWGVAEAQVDWVVDPMGVLRQVIGSRGVVTLAHDALGRLTAWGAGAEDPTGPGIVRDALGRLVSVGGVEALGWEGCLAFSGAARASVPDVGEARPGGGVLVDARRVPMLVVPGGLVAVAPSGLPLTAATGDLGSGGRFQPLIGGPLIGLGDAIDPLSGQTTSAPWNLPGRERDWEVGQGETPWPEPDASAHPGWDPGLWAPESVWADPLRLLVDAGLLPYGGVRATRPPGLPWLPASAAETVPAPVRDPRAVDLHFGPVEAWVIAHARAPVQPAAPGDLVAWLLHVEVNPGAQPGAAGAGQPVGVLGSGSDVVVSELLFGGGGM